MWKRVICFVLTALMLLSLAGCGGKKPEPVQEEQPPVEQSNQPGSDDKTTPSQPEEPVEEERVLNPLTGLPLEDPEMVNARPIAVMLNNIQAAMPQHGIGAADIVFEYNVEYGITRMVGFYQEPALVGTIGSVRSARACYVETVYGMDAIYMHAGGSAEANRMLRQLAIDDIDEDAGEDRDESGPHTYWRDAERYKTMAWEHTLMTSGKKIVNYLENSSMRRDHEDGYTYPITFVEDATPANGEAATHVAVRFSTYKTGVFDYDADSGLYMISQYGKPHIDGNTNEQISTTNLLVLRTSVVNSGDSAGHMNIDLQGSNSGMFFCGGKMEPITWVKEKMSDPFTYYHADGTPLELQAGRTYVCVIGLNETVSYNG